MPSYKSSEIKFDEPTGIDASQIQFDEPAPIQASMAPSFSGKVANFISEEGTPAAGAMLGAAASLPYAPFAGPFAPLVPVAGAAMGAMGARGLQRTYQYATGQREIPSTQEAISDIGSAGAGGALGEGGGQLLGAAGKAIAPGAKRVTQQVIRGLTGVRENISGAALSNPKLLTSAPSKEVVSDAYKAFENYSGLQGIQSQEVASGHLASPTEMIQNIFATGQKLVNNQAVDPQELYSASQYASRLKQMAKYQNPPPEVVARVGAIDQGKRLIDDALEKVFPEYKSMRGDYFARKVTDQLSSFAPLQRNLSPDALRMGAQIGVGAHQLYEGDPGEALIGVAAMSPFAWGMGIRAGGLALGAARTEAAQFGGRVLAQSGADIAAMKVLGGSYKVDTDSPRK